MSKFARSLLSAVGMGAVIPASAWAQPTTPAAKVGMELIRVSQDGRRFVLAESGAEFRPWGFNYDHDAANRLLETYWRDEWTAVTGDFEEMKQLAGKTPDILRPTAAQPVKPPGDRPPERVPVRGHAAPGNDRMPWQ